jgi:hypothetical protein
MTTRKAGMHVAGADGWIEHHGDAYRYPVFVTTGPPYTAASATHPAATCTGGTEADALAAVTAELARLVGAAKSTGGNTPRTDPAATPPPGAVRRWVIVRTAG